jgi:imidazole glycerol phosphate synthase subunit HisF
VERQVTLARRICALVECDETGKPKTSFNKGGLDVDFVEAIANHLGNDGADEVWLRAPSPKSLYTALDTLAKHTFVPIVAWAPCPTPADARLLLGFGADRVVVDVNLGLPDPLGFVARVAHDAGPDRITAALHVRRFVGDGQMSKGGVLFELVDPNGDGAKLDAIVLAERLAQSGACEILLVPSVPAPQSDRLVHDGELIEQVSSLSSIPVLAHGDDREIADLATPLLMGADGVATALFSTGTPTVQAGKIALAEFGLPLRPPE